MSQEIFRQLLDQYISGELSSGEKERLNEMMNDDAYQDTLASVVREVMLSDVYIEIDNPALKARIDAWLDTHFPVEQQEHKATLVSLEHWKPRSRIVAAAILLLLAVGSYFLILPKSQKKTALTEEQRFRNDVAPRWNGAVLTLADGQKIVLDSTTNGKIGMQGNITVTNTNGRLMYNISDEKPARPLYNTLTTKRGNQYQVVLPDGSKVWLNAASSLTYPTVFTSGQRRVTITGEAYFEVVRNDKLPFIVQKGKLSVQVLGTRFNLNTYDDEHVLTATLLEGSIKVIKGRNSNVLKPGQQAILTDGAAPADSHDRIRVIDDADIGEAMSWKNGKFKFTDATIGSIMRQIERWYDVDVVYDTRISQHFTADIPRDVPLPELLKLLEMTEQVHFKIEGRKITVIP
jgi:ferric-dicitrate binding protein FerR (iron transport regulator)